MKERPILFSGEMIRAILDRQKTQTRRIVRPQPKYSLIPSIDSPTGFFDGDYFDAVVTKPVRCPYGVPGDRLWVRETFKDHTPFLPEDALEELGGTCVLYRADDPSPEEIRWQPSIHMPRWASRITLEIVNVRVEQLQEIGEADAKAEGVSPHYSIPAVVGGLPFYGVAFRELWERIHGAASWIWDPWVWVIEFCVVDR